LNFEVVEKVRSAVCAIGYLEVDMEQAKEEPREDYFNIAGTGFLIDETTVLTNAHVIKKLKERMSKYDIPNSQRGVRFGYRTEHGWTQLIIGIREWVEVDNWDFGLIRVLNRVKERNQLERLVISEQSSDVQRVGKPVGACGFAYGRDLLRREGKNYRFGPIIQQGHISAIAPYDSPGQDIEEFLLDMRVPEGMSGSPLFLPESGVVVGIIYETMEPTVAFALPLNTISVKHMLEMFAEAELEAE